MTESRHLDIDTGEVRGQKQTATELTEVRENMRKSVNDMRMWLADSKTLQETLVEENDDKSVIKHKQGDLAEGSLQWHLQGTTSPLG